MSTFTKHFLCTLLGVWLACIPYSQAQISSKNNRELKRKSTVNPNSTNDIQTSEIEVISVSERSALISGIGLSFGTQDKVNSGTGNFQWGFIHNADSLYLGHFAPPGNPNSEPYLVYIKCFYPGATFTNNAQVYDNFNPNFGGIGGVNFVAFIKNDYDEYRTWNGTAWSNGVTSLNPRFSNAPQNKNIEVALPWSAIIPGGGIPDSIHVVCYRTNGNAFGIFSYAQMPEGLPSGGNATPAVNQKFSIKVKENFSLLKPYRFGQQVLTTPSDFRFLAYNPGSNSTTINGNLTSSADTIFTIPVQPAATIASKKYSPFFVSFQPKKATVKYEATIGIPNNSANNPFQFKVTGTGKGIANVSATAPSGPVAGSISFGEDVTPNTPVNISITVKSTGDDTAFFSPYISSNPTQFQVVSVGTNVLPPGQSTNMILRFVGANTGSYTGKVYMLSLGEGSIRFDLNVVVGTGNTPPTIDVLNIPRRFVSIDGNTNTGWQGSEAQNSASPGIQWYVAHSPDSLYIARTGGNNSEPQILYINGIYPGAVQTNIAFGYDGVSGNLASQGSLNFLAYLKSGYDEFRNWDGSAWTAGNTSLNPRYGNPGGNETMEIAIPWSAITNGKGIPDSIKLALLQTNGNVGSPFVYGSFPASNPTGALGNPVINQMLKREIARKVTSSQEFSFGSLVTGSVRDTTLLIYNSSDVDLTSFTNVTFPIGTGQLQLIQGPPSSILARKYAPFKFRFTAPGAGPFTGQGSANYSFNGNGISNTFKITADVLPLPQAVIQVKVGNTIFNSTDSLRFGNLVIGSQKDSTIKVKNIGNDTLRINVTSISGGSFSFVQPLGLKIAPNDSSFLKIRFTSNAPIGSKTSQLTINSNAGNINVFSLNLKGISINAPFVASTLEIRNIANNAINTSGLIPQSQLQPKFLLSDNGGIKWYASWDTTNLYVVKLGGNRAEPQIIYLKASYPGAVFTDQPTIYDGFHPGFTGIGGINYTAYFKETAIPYDEFRNWNGTLWTFGGAGLQPQYGNQAGQDIFAVRIPWSDITQGNGVPDSLKLVMYQTNGTPGNFFAYAQSPVGLPSGNAVTPPVNLSHNKKIITRLPKNSEFDFGSVPIGTTVDTTFLLQNEGPSGSFVINNGPASITGSAFSAVSQTGAGTSIPSKKWGFVKVRFAPTALGDVTGNLTANATFTNPTAPYIVNFKGKGVPTPVAGIVLKIGNTIITNGSTSNLGIGEIGTQLDTTVRVINIGDDSLKIGGLGSILPGWTIVGFPAGKVRAGDSTSFKIRRTSVSTGNNAGQFSIGTNVPNLPLFGFSININGDSALSWSPGFPTINDSITITYNAAFANKALKDTNRIFIHTGVVTSNPIGTNWTNVQGNFNQAADSVKMTNLGNNLHRIKFKIRDFYNLVGNPQVFRLGMLFRNGNGSRAGKTRNNEDFYIQTNPIPSASQILLRSASGGTLANNATINFGSRTIGTIKDTSIFVKNTGSTALVFTSIAVNGSSYSQFGTSPLTVAVGDSIQIVIRLTVGSTGILSGGLILQSNAANLPFVNINLTANGLVSNASRIENEKAWSIYPNPASEFLNVQNAALTKDVKWSILDLNGKAIQNGQNQLPISIQVSGLPKGMYLLKMESESNPVYRKFTVK